MKAISKLASAVWAWLNGKKSIIALIYWTVVTPSLPILWPAGIPGALNKVYLIMGIVLSALGLGHAAIKSYLGGKTAAVVEDPVTPPK